jgi:L-tyrosine isonitrile desaturase/decarboxylase
MNSSMAGTAKDPILSVLQPFGAIITAPSNRMVLSEISPNRLREEVAEHGLVTLRGFAPPVDADAFLEYGKIWGDLLEWPFGFVFDVLAHEDPDDHAYDTGFMPMHWDGMYADHIPQFQIFHCVTAPPSAQGGRTLFCNTSKLLADAEPEVLGRWKKLTLRYENPKLNHYGGLVVSPLIEQHPITGVPVMRFLEAVPADKKILNPPIVRIEGMEADEEALTLQRLSEIVRDERYTYAHQWHEGDIVITDNYTLLHTRESYARGLPRHLRRIHVLGSPPRRSNLRSVSAEG